MSTNFDHQSTMRALSEFLRRTDDDAQLAERFQEAPEETLRAAGVDKAFDNVAFSSFVDQLTTLHGEAWWATVHSMMELAELDARAEPPAGPNVYFRLSEAGGVTAVANRGDIARNVGENPFYRAENTNSTAPQAQRVERPSVKVRLHPDFETSELSQRLGERYLSSFYQRTLIKRVVLDPETVVEDTTAPDDVVVNRSEYRGVRFEVRSRLAGNAKEIVAAHTL